MHISHTPVNPHVQPQLFRDGGLALRVEALIDYREGTIVWVVSGMDPISTRLTSLWSTSPRPFQTMLQDQREAGQEFTKVLHDAIEPFPGSFTTIPD